MAEGKVSPNGREGKARWRDVPRGRMKGLTFHQRDKTWIVQITRDGELVPGGRYRYKRDAIEARDRLLVGVVPERVTGYPIASAMAGKPVNYLRWVFYPQGLETFTRWTGDAIQADRWMTRCFDCGTEFTFLLPRPDGCAGQFRPTRYCPDHAHKETRRHDAIRPEKA